MKAIVGTASGNGVTSGGKGSASSPAGAGVVNDTRESDVTDLARWFGRAGPIGLVRNAFVTPVWIGDTDMFWYKQDTADGHRFLIVDASSGQLHAAFDHEALAAELSRLGIKDVAADRLAIDELRFSYDGQMITFDADDRSFECPLATMQCTPVAGATAGRIVSPDGKRAAFIRDADLWIVEIASGQEHQLTTDGQPENGYGIYPDGWKASFVARSRSSQPLVPWLVQWSPDSRRLLVPHIDQRHVEPYPFVEHAPADRHRPRVHQVRLPLAGERPANLTWHVADVVGQRVVRIDLPYGRMLALQQDLVAIRRISWSADGAYLRIVAHGDDLKTAFLFEADTASGAVRTVIEEEGAPLANLNSTSYNPANVQIANDGADIIWFSERSGWGHLYLYDGRTGALKRQLTSGDWLVRDIIKVDEAAGLIYFTGAGREPGDVYYRYLYRTDFDGADPVRLTPDRLDHLLTGEDNDVLALDGAKGYKVISPSGDYFVCNASALDRVPEASIRRTSDGGLVAVFERADASRLLAAGYQPPVPFALRAAEGDELIHGVLYKPTDLDPAKHYPIVDAQYGSPVTAVVPHNFMSAVRVPSPLQPNALAQSGFAAVVLDSRGTTYRSRAFSQGMLGRLDTMNLDDHVAVIRQLADQYDWIDLGRVGITGASYGGWTTLRALLTQGDFFKAGVAGVPPASFHDMYVDYHWSAFQGAPQYKDGGTQRKADLEMPENWEHLASDNLIDRLQGKLLILIGALDENVPVAPALRFFEKAAAAGKDVSLVYVPSANHGTTMTAYTFAAAIDFFKRHLGGPLSTSSAAPDNA